MSESHTVTVRVASGPYPLMTERQGLKIAVVVTFPFEEKPTGAKVMFIESYDIPKMGETVKAIVGRGRFLYYEGNPGNYSKELRVL